MTSDDNTYRGPVCISYQLIPISCQPIPINYQSIPINYQPIPISYQSNLGPEVGGDKSSRKDLKSGIRITVNEFQLMNHSVSHTLTVEVNQGS